MSPESNLKRFYRVKQGVKRGSCGVILGEGKGWVLTLLCQHGALPTVQHRNTLHIIHHTTGKV